MESIKEPRGWKKCVTSWVVGLTLLGFGAIYAGISLFTADRLTRPTNHPSRFDPRAWDAGAQPWSTRTADGITLRGWYLPTQDRRHLIVLVHGMWSSWLEMAALGRDLHGRGFDVLLFDLRGHGQSDPSRLYLGRRERADIRAVMTWARNRGLHERPDRLAGLFDGRLDGLDGGRPKSRDPGGRPRQPLRRPAQAPQQTAQQAQRAAGLVQPGHPAGGPVGLRRADRRPGPDPVRPGVGRAAAARDPWRIRHDRSGQPGSRAGQRRRQLVSDDDACPASTTSRPTRAIPRIRPASVGSFFNDHLSP